MNILLHSCCGPCTIYPLSVLREHGYDVTGHFFNPNIHPYKEFKRRLNALKDLAKVEKLPLIVEDKYGLKEFIRNVAYNEEQRCIICYRSRLEESVKIAVNNGFSAFSTTLLYSKYQNHKLLRSLCQNYCDQAGIEFVYFDFREGWQKGIDASIEMELYRQPYCGCIYSEQERYDKSLRKKKVKATNHKSLNSQQPQLPAGL